MRTYEPLKFLGRLFVVPLRVGRAARPISYAPTWEQDPPYRFGPTLVLRVPRIPVGLGLGVWLDSEVDDLEAERLDRLEMEAADAAYDAYCAVNGDVQREKWEAARAKIAEMGLDPDDEMGLMQHLGVFE